MHTTDLHPSKTPALLFDLDGTLLDSFPAHFRAYLAMFQHYDIQVTEESFYRLYSPNWLETYRRVGLPEEKWSEADEVWMEEALKHQPELFPGAGETLQTLGQRYRLGLVTSGSKDRVLGDLRRNGILDTFEVIITGGDIQRPKPDPQGLQMALEQLGLGVEQAVYIGDALADYETARNAGMRFIGIPSHFASLTPDIPCPQVKDLSELLMLILGEESNHRD